MIHRAGINEIGSIRAMAEVVFRQTYREILSPEQMEYMMNMMYSEKNLRRQMAEEGHVYFIDEGRGYASYRLDGVTEDGRERYHLEKLYVMPAWQKTGLGLKLFNTITEAVKGVSSSPSPLLELNVNRGNPALGFYERLGMRRARSGDFPIGNGFYMNDYIMAIDL